MARTIDMTQLSSSGKHNNYTSIYLEVQGPAEVGDTILLRDGEFQVTRVSPHSYQTKTGFTKIELSIRKIGA